MHQVPSNEDNKSETQNLASESNQHDVAGPSDVSAGSEAGDDESAAYISRSASPAALPNIEQTADMLKLDIDCCEEAFDYLPLEDLINVGKTCKRLKKVIGFILHQYYPGLHANSKHDRIYVYSGVNLNMNHLAGVIRRIHIFVPYNSQYFWKIHSKCYKLREIDIFYINLDESKIDGLKRTLNRLEVIRLYNSDVSGDFNENFLKFCPNIKTLSIFQENTVATILVGNGNEWMHQNYPTLEHFACDNTEIAEMQTLLEVNQNIRKFSVQDDYIQQYAHSLMTANIKLDELEVEMGEVDRKFIDQLNALYERGFYQHLRLYLAYWLHDDDISQYAELNGLVTFHMMDPPAENIQLSKLTGLKELYIIGNEKVEDLSALPINLPSLERIQFKIASTDDILPFIRQSMNLEKIKVDDIRDGTYFKTVDNVINLVKLNEERTKLEGAEKMTIYVREKVYLATKWAIRETDYATVRLKRIDSCDWDNTYTYHY